eukprot:13294790-Alexandrium_andersonii.AAC.1
MAHAAQGRVEPHGSMAQAGCNSQWSLLSAGVHSGACARPRRSALTRRAPSARNPGWRARSSGAGSHGVCRKGTEEVQGHGL